MDEGGRSYRLEPLEPRLLLSANGLIEEIAAAVPTTSDPGAVVVDVDLQDQTTIASESASTYVPERELSNLFASQPLAAAGADSPAEDPAPAEASASAAQVVEVRADTAPQEAEVPASASLPASPAEGSLTETLVDTLKAAEPPPDAHLTADEPLAAHDGFTVGTLTGSGTIVGDVSVVGLHSPGNSPGTTEVTGDYELGPDASLVIEIGGLAQGTQYDWLNVTGTATLSGTLEVVVLEGFTPNVGNTFTFVTAAGGVTADFSAVGGLAIGEGLYFDLQETATELRLVVKQAADLTDIQSEIDARLQDGTFSGTFTLDNDVRLAGLFSIESPTLTFSISYDGSWTGTVSIEAGGASLFVGAGLTASLSDTDGDGVAFAGSYTLSGSATTGGGSYFFSADRFKVSIPGLLTGQADNVEVTYTPGATGAQPIAEVDDLSVTLIPLDGASITINDLLISTDGFSVGNAAFHASTVRWAGALSIQDLEVRFSNVAYSTGSSLTGTLNVSALEVRVFAGETAFRASVRGFTGSYDIATSALSLAATDLAIRFGGDPAALEINATGLTINVDLEADTFAVTATSVTVASPRFPSLPTATVTNLSVSEAGVSFDTATVGPADLTIGGTLTLAQYEITGEGFSYSAATDNVAGRISASVDGVTLFGGVSFFTVEVTGFTGEYDLVAGDLALGASGLLIAFGDPAILRLKAADVAFSLDPAADTFSLDAGSVELTSPRFAALPKLTITHLVVTRDLISFEDATLGPADVSLGALELEDVVLEASRFSYTYDTNTVTGTFTVTAGGVALFSGQSAFTVSVSGFSASYDIITADLRLGAEKIDIAVGTLLEVSAADVVFELEPFTVTLGLLSVASPRMGLTGTVESAEITESGFSIGSATIAADEVDVGVLHVTDLELTATDIGYTVAGGAQLDGIAVTFASAGISAGEAFSATLEGVEIAVNTSSGHEGELLVSVETFTFTLGGFLTAEASSVGIDTAADADHFAVGFGSITATLGDTGIGGTLGYTGAEDPAPITFGFDGAGRFKIAPDASFGFELTTTGADGGGLGWPSWLPVTIEDLDVEWENITGNPADFTITFSGGIHVEGFKNTGIAINVSVKDIVIDVGALLNGEFPITAIGEIRGSVSGNMFGGSLEAGLLLGIARFDPSDGAVVDVHGIRESDGEQAASIDSVFYAGFAGGFSFAGMAGFELRLGLSEDGPLAFFVSATVPVVIVPPFGITLSSFRAGISFNNPMPEIATALDLRGQAFVPMAEMDADDWLAMLPQQVVMQYRSGEGSWDNLLESTIRIEGGATMTITPAGEDVFNADVDVIFTTDGKFLIDADANFAADSLSLGFKLYCDFTEIGDLVSAGAGDFQIAFLMDLPNLDIPGGPSLPPIYSIYGLIDFAFTTTSAVVHVDGGAAFSLLGALEAEVTGQIALTFAANGFNMKVSALMSVTYLEEIGQAAGDLTVVCNGDDVDVWGALFISADLEKLEELGIFASGDVFVRLNTTTVAHTVSLALPADPDNPRSFELKPESFGLLVEGTGSFKLPGDASDGPALFDVDGTLAVDVLEDRLTVFVNGTLGFGPGSLLSFATTGLLVINDQGLAARMTLSMATDGSGVPGLTFGANFHLVVNTTSQLVEYEIPAAADPAIGPIDTISGPDPVAGNPLNTVVLETVVDGRRLLTIPAGAPALSDGALWTTPAGSEGAYAVVFGGGELSLLGAVSLEGGFRLIASLEPVELLVHFDASVSLGPLGSMAAVGDFQATSAGVVVSLQLGAGGGLQTRSGIGFSFTACFQLEVNTTDAPAVLTLIDPATGTPATGTLAAETVRLAVGGNLNLANAFALDGYFLFTGGAQSLAVHAQASMSLGPLGSMAAVGDFQVSDAGLVFSLQLGVGGGLQTRSGTGFSFTACFQLEVNTTGAPAALTLIDPATGTLIGGTLAADTVRLAVGGTLQLLGAFSVQGYFELEISANYIEVDAYARLSFFNITLTLDGQLGIYGGTDPGLATSLSLTLGGNSNVTFGVPGLFEIGAQLVLQLNTRQSTGTFGVDPRTIRIAMNGATLNILTVIQMSASGYIQYTGGVFEIGVGTEASPVTLSLFGFADFRAWGWLRSSGEFDFNFRGNINLGGGGFGVFGAAWLSIGWESSAGLHAYGGATVDVKAFGVTLTGAGLSFAYDSASGRISLTVTVKIWLLFGTVTKSFTFTIGYLKTPPPVYLAGNWDDNGSAQFRGGVLYLNMGARAAFRNLDPDAIDEFYVIEDIGAGSSNGRKIRISAMGRTQIFDNATGIVGYAGSGMDYVEVVAGVLVPAEIHGGDDVDQIIFSHTPAAGQDNAAFGDAGDDYLLGGPGADRLYGGDGADSIISAGGIDTVDGGAGGDFITWVWGDGNDASVSGGPGSDTFNVAGANDPESLRVMTPAAAQFSIACLGTTTSLTASSIEILNLDLAGGADSLVVDDISGSGLGQISVDLGDGAADAVTVRGSESGDSFAISDLDGAVNVVRAGVTTVSLRPAVRADGDALTVDARGGNDALDAGGLLTNLMALTLIGGGGNDTLVGSPFADVIDSGTGSDTVTGGASVDVFIDGSGIADVDTLVETFDRDMSLFDDRFVAGTIVGDPGGPFGRADHAVEESTAPADPLFPAPVTFPLIDTGDHYAAGAEVETLAGIFERATLRGGSGNNTIVVSDLDGTIFVGGAGIAVDAWTGSATLDNGSNSGTLNEYTIINASGASGSRIDIADSGASSDYDVLWINGTGGNDRFYLNAGDRGAEPTAAVVVVGLVTDPLHEEISHRQVDRVMIASGAGNDFFSSDDTSVLTVIDTGTDDDTIVVGTRTVVAGTEHVTNGNSAVMAVYGGAGNDAFEVNHASAQLYLSGGGHDDTFDVRTIAGDTTISAGAGADSVSVGSAAPAGAGVLDGISALLTVLGGAGSDGLRVDDSGDDTANEGSLTSSTIRGLDMADGIDYQGFETLDVYLADTDDTFGVLSTHAGPTRVESGAGGDRIDVRTIAGPTSILAGGDDDTVNVGSLAPALVGMVDGITDLLTIDAGSGFDTLNVDDSDDVGPNTGWLTSATIRGLGMAQGIDYAAFEALTVRLGLAGDLFNVETTHGGTTLVNMGGGADIANVITIQGSTRIEGGSGNDHFFVNVDEASVERGINGIGAPLELDGQAGSDDATVYLAGAPYSSASHESIITVRDTGGGAGTDLLEIFGTDDPSVADELLVRANFVALLVIPGGGAGASAERVNYDATIDRGLTIYGRAGDDRFTLDDNSTVTTISGGDGDDGFQVGQLFQSERDVPHVAAGDRIETLETTRGWLTVGISAATAISGGAGNDRFTVFHNQATLRLDGDDGDDQFAVRAFALATSHAADPAQQLTEIDSGLGADYIEYASNAPVSIDGGGGSDTVVITGTEFGDRFVITSSEVYGAGLMVEYAGVETLKVDGAEGNDTFVVVSTNAQVETTLFGGLGSDTFEVADEAAPQTLEDIRGPLTIHGGVDPTAESEIPIPVMYLHEENPDELAAADNPNFDVVEAGQVDTLIVSDADSDSGGAGSLTESRLVGFGMGPDGIVYGDIESLVVRLGSGGDRLVIETTHGGSTAVYAGGGDDAVSIRTLGGFSTIFGEAGNDTVNVGSAFAGALANADVEHGGDAADGTVDLIDAPLVVDGGPGSDALNVDDSGDSTADVVVLTAAELTGLDFAEAVVQVVELVNANSGKFTLTAGGITTDWLPYDCGSQAIRAALMGLNLPNVVNVLVNRAGDSFTVVLIGGERLEAAAVALTGDASALVSSEFQTPAVAVTASASNLLQALTVNAAVGSWTVGLGEVASFTLSAGMSAADVEAAILNALWTVEAYATVGFRDVSVSMLGNTYLVYFQGELAGLAGAGLKLSAAPAAQVAGSEVLIDAVGGSFRLAVDGGLWTWPLAFNASAAEVAQALSCALGGASVSVIATPAGYSIVDAAGALSVDGRSLVASVQAGPGASGIRYAALETLNVDLGSAGDVVNARGTSADTSIYGNDGSDRFFVSSLAAETLASAPALDFLEGCLDDIRGDLHIHAGSGRHKLMISDEASLSGDLDVVITGGAAAEISVTGLAPAAITYDAAADGTFADGITYWAGWGSDRIAINATHRRLGAGTATTLNTGLGDDEVTVDLEAGADGFFVLNTQGPYDAYVALGDDDVADGSASSLPLIIFGGQGNDSLAGGSGQDVLFGDRGRVVYFVSAGNPATVLGNGGPGDRTDGIERPAGEIITVDAAVGGDDELDGNAGNDLLFGGTADDEIYAGDDSDLVFGDMGRVAGAIDVGALPLATAGPFTFTSIDVHDPLGGSDTIFAGSGADIVLGGQGDDRIYGEEGDDDLIGGHNVAGGHDGDDSVDGGGGHDVIAGDNAGILRRGDAVSPLVGVLDGALIYDSGDLTWVTAPRINPRGVESRDIAIFDHSSSAASDTWGHDRIAGGAGDDVIFGQLGDDVIHGDGTIDAPAWAGRDAGGLLVVDPSAEGTGDGDDYIEGGGGSDVIFGGLGPDDIIGGSSSLFGLGTAGQRPDGSDLIFGGAGTEVARNDLGDGLHGADSDMILGDNGNIYRLVSAATGSYLTFSYDNYGEARRILVRAAELLDYTPGGPDYTPTAAAAAADIGAADEIHGESGDDFVYGQVGNDVLFGESGDDDLVGGWGNDWISGGTGQDGVIGDDGRIATSRNGTAEPLYGIAATTPKTIETPGGVFEATTDAAGQLKKTVNLTPFKLGDPDAYDYAARNPAGADDVIFGGLGSDFLHGGDGDDAISGAEAPARGAVLLFDAYTAPDPDRRGTVVESSYARPCNPGNLLGFEAYRAREFALYDEYDPRTRITLALDGAAVDFFLNFSAKDVAPDGPAARNSDGDDAIFGDLGNDWLAGGTGRDHLYGGYGNDLLNGDDDLSTNLGANDRADTDATYEDLAYGGAGRDVLIANTGGDRLVDWAGEFNSYIVPYSPFGYFTISRGLQPQIAEFLYAVSASDGADPTRSADTGAEAARNGEPEGELGLVKQQDFDWRDQTGAPDDPQPGNIPGGKRDVLRSATFNDGSMEAFAPDSGVWEVNGGQMSVSAASLGGDAAAVFYVEGMLPIYYEIQASITVVKPTAGWTANAYVIFDYVSPTDFKFAGINISLNKIQMGHRTAQGWIADVQTSAQLKPDTVYNMLVAVNGTTATVLVNGTQAFSHAFAPRVVDGYSYGLNYGMVGTGSSNSRGTFDNVAVQILPPAFTLAETEDFADGAADRFIGASSGEWEVGDGRYDGAPASGDDPALSLVDPGLGRGLEAGAILQLEAALRTPGTAGLVFDYYGPEDYKFVAIDAAADRVIVGHRTSKRGVSIDAVAFRTIDPDVDHSLLVSLKGSTVSVSLDAQAVLGYVFNGVTVDGGFGLIATGGSASFDKVTIRTDDPAFAGLAAARAPEAAAGAAALAADDLASIVDEAKSRWIASGALDEADLARLDRVTFVIGDLEGLSLAVAAGTTITIDDDAAGWGWFVDATPADDVEYGAPASNEAVGRMDLLTVVMHEIGHVLGYEHDEGGLMAASLDAGARLTVIDASPEAPAAACDALPRLDAAAILVRPSGPRVVRDQQRPAP